MAAVSTLPPPCGFEFAGRRCRQRGAHRCRYRVAHVLAFFCEILTHTRGIYARRPFVPAPWEKRRILAPLFGEVAWDASRGRYIRKYRVLYLYLPRKNGKTSLLGGIVLYLLVADQEYGAEVYGLALDREQADLVGRAARAMVRNSPTLRERLNVIPSAARIVDAATSSVFAVLAGDALGALGIDPSGAYIDELLSQSSRDLYDAVRTSFGSRAQPMLLLATTAEADPNGFAASEREFSERVAEDPSLDPERLVVMYSAPVEDDWTSPKTWAKANPALGDFLEVRTLASECRQAIGNPAAERAFRQYRLNQPAKKVGRAIDLNVWDASAGEVPAAQLPGELRRRACYAGLDLASTSDLAAYCLDFPEPGGGHSLIWRHFAPASALRDINRRTGGRADTWVGQGFLHITEGDVIDYGAIVAAMNADRERFDIRSVAFDRWGATQLSSQLIDEGWPLVSMGQGFASMAAPTAEFLRLVRAGLYHHGNNPVARWEASNVVTRTDPGGNLKVDKGASAEKVDGMVAGVMALDRSLRDSGEPDYAAAGF